MLWVGLDRTIKTLLRFFRFQGKERSAKNSVRVQRYVAGVHEGDREESAAGDLYSGPVSCDAEDEQSDRQGPCGGSETDAEGWLRTAAERESLAPAQTS